MRPEEFAIANAVLLVITPTVRPGTLPAADPLTEGPVSPWSDKPVDGYPVENF